MVIGLTLTAAETTAETTPSLLMPSTPPRRQATVRFALIYTALGLILVGSLAAFVVFALRPGFSSSPAWSSWKPPSGRLPVMAKAIADHVAPKYRLATGGQLVAVVASAPAVTAGTQNVAIDAVAIRSRANGNQSVRRLEVGKSEMYTLCGLGNDCAIASGQPSFARGRLVRREGLEVALSTFKYVPAVDSVIVFMPPALGSTVRTALFFERQNLSSLLDRPLKETLPLATPPRAGQDDRIEAGVIDALTLPKLYMWQLIQLQVGGALIALTPIA